MPERIQRRRTKGWRMPPNTVSVTRPGPWGNPFRVGDFCKIGDPDPRRAGLFKMAWCRTSVEYATPDFTYMADAATTVAFFRRLMASGYYPPAKLETLRGKNLACYCPVGSPCHADVLLEYANK